MDWLFTLFNLSYMRKLLKDRPVSQKNKSKKQKDETAKPKKISDKKILDYLKNTFELFNNLKIESDKAGYRVEELIRNFENKK